MRFATYTSDGQTYYGAVTDAGMVALNDAFPQWPSLLDVVKAGGLNALVVAADRPVTHADYDFEMVLPNAPRCQRLSCIKNNLPGSYR